MTSETDNKVEAAEYVRGAINATMTDYTQVPPSILRALLSSKEAADRRCDRLAANLDAERFARIEAVETMAAERKFYTAEFNRLKAKLSALVEASRDAIAAAYEQGCVDTHTSIQAEPELALVPVESAEFGEAARDYTIDALASLDRTASAESIVTEPIFDNNGRLIGQRLITDLSLFRRKPGE